MRRLATVLACVLSVSAVAAQSQNPPPAPASAPAKAKYVPPVKGAATIEVIQSPSKRVGNEMVTVLRVRNTSKGSINLLKADEYWYDKSMKMVSAGQYAHKKAPILPGEIVEITMRSPVKPNLYRSQVMFRHAYGDIKAKAVKEFK